MKRQELALHKKEIRVKKLMKMIDPLVKTMEEKHALMTEVQVGC